MNKQNPFPPTWRLRNRPNQARLIEERDITLPAIAQFSTSFEFVSNSKTWNHFHNELGQQISSQGPRIVTLRHCCSKAFL